MINKNSRILITGGDGMLAGSFKEYSHLPNILFLNKKELDITSWKDVSNLSDVPLSAIIHLAAVTDVDFCEKNHKVAERINTYGTYNLVKLAKRKSIPFFFSSTSAVFDGRSSSAYHEFDKTHPINFYAKTKLEAEEIIRGTLKDFTIIRLGWLLGGDKKFLMYIKKQIMDNVKEIKAVDDIKGTITFTQDVVRFIERSIMNRDQGIFHLASKGSCSRYELAKKIVKMSKKKISVIPVPNKFFKDRYPAPRPQNESIISVRKIHGFTHPTSWQKTIEKILSEDPSFSRDE